MTVFVVDEQWFSLSALPRCDLLDNWLKEEHGELLAWIEQSVTGPYRFEADLLDFEYETCWARYQLRVTYEVEDDAFHHRMRW